MRRPPRRHPLGLAVLTTIALLGAACADDDTAGVRAEDGGLDEDFSVAAVITTLDDVTVFDTALFEAEVRSTLEDLDAEYTVLAPTDDAFTRLAAANDATALDLLAGLEDESPLLGYHVLEGLYTLEELAALDGEEVPTLAGEPVTITGGDEQVVINGSAAVVRGDLPADNGLVHVIGGVLLPPGIELEEPPPGVTAEGEGLEGEGLRTNPGPDRPGVPAPIEGDDDVTEETEGDGPGTGGGASDSGGEGSGHTGGGTGGD